jgi:hypothetical protein
MTGEGVEMKNKLALILCAGFSVLILFVVIRTQAGRGGPANRHASSTVKVKSETGCLTESEVLNSLEKMVYSSQPEANQARETLLNEARRSAGCRTELIAAVMSALDKPDQDFDRDPVRMYPLWREGAKLLGDLKAAEAVELLVSHLYLNTGSYSTTMSHRPAVWGVINMGELAIPKLSAVLRESPDPEMRLLAVYCISAIGGQTAISALKQALDSEPDHCVNRFIRVSIDSLDNKHYSLGGDTRKWYWAFMCKE